VTDPWPLTCRGAGPNATLLHAQPGVTDAGFMQPGQLPEAFHEHRAFVLPSRYEPWGVVIAEAAAAGLPVICSSACGAAADVVKPYVSGVVVPPDDAEALASALQWVHEHQDELDDLGRRGRQLAHAYSAGAWASRWRSYMIETLDRVSAA
jgi:glycosyltransferase involved in cell wall biosynthesis